MFYKTITTTKWGDEDYIDYYKCDECGFIMQDGWPRYIFNKGHLCLDCSFRNGIVSETSYANLHGISLNKTRVAINPINNEIEIVTNSKFSWEKKDKDYRANPLYRECRNKVFERDNYTCKICGQVGKELEAHHIKHFKEYKDLRYEVNNGITLCKTCHRNLHKEERNKK